MRLFIGIHLSRPVVEELSAFTLGLRSAGDGLRWSLPESWHITLQFLGNTTQDQLDCILPRLREIRSGLVPVQLEATGFFDRAGIFFADVRVTPELRSLHQQVSAATNPCGFQPEDRPYHPHITLAQTKGKSGSQSMKVLKKGIKTQPSFTPFAAQEFALYESFLGREGSRYEIREHFLLG